MHNLIGGFAVALFATMIAWGVVGTVRTILEERDS